ncbi:hypothetical protein Leryth_018726 [Lithospermum erythrorhizon]|nr:hypothetical protein Leryth_018726 [Lithospermum erythrorhizon]
MDSSPRFRRTGSGSGRYPSMQVPVSDMPMNSNPNRGMARNSSSLDPYEQDNEGYGGMSRMLSRNESRSVDRGGSRFDSSFEDYGNEDDGHDHSNESPGGSSGGGKPVKMSLMALLAETDKEMGLDGSKYMMDDDDFDQEEEEEEEQQTYKKEKFNHCSVCMVRHHGDAFAACGHTFCRLCSRELSIERGNCPLCNNFILEILDVF